MGAMSRAQRDRDERGRARNARPRDALGRPLARTAGGTYVEEALPEDPAALLVIGIRHFDARRFFQAHEAWETAWHRAPVSERDFWQGITQIAVGFTHLQRGNARGAVTLLRRGATKLEKQTSAPARFPAARLARAAREVAGTIERDGLDARVTFPKIARA